MHSEEPPGARPNLFIVGAPRCGTSSIYRVLGECPTVHAPQMKEPHGLLIGCDDVGFDGDFERHPWGSSYADYAAMYEDPSVKWRLDGSSSYLYSSCAANKIARITTARCIILVRHPAVRALSAFKYLRALGLEPNRSLQEALRAEPERRRNGWSPIYWYRAAGEYARFIAQYQRIVGRERICVLDLDSLTQDEIKVCLVQYLGLGDTRMLPDIPRVNRSGTPRHGQAYQWFSTPHVVKDIVASRLPSRWRTRMRRIVEWTLLQKGDEEGRRKQPAVPPQLDDLAAAEQSNLRALGYAVGPWT